MMLFKGGLPAPIWIKFRKNSKMMIMIMFVMVRMMMMVRCVGSQWLNHWYWLGSTQKCTNSSQPLQRRRSSLSSPPPLPNISRWLSIWPWLVKWNNSEMGADMGKLFLAVPRQCKVYISERPFCFWHHQKEPKKSPGCQLGECEQENDNPTRWALVGRTRRATLSLSHLRRSLHTLSSAGKGDVDVGVKYIMCMCVCHGKVTTLPSRGWPCFLECLQTHGLDPHDM